MSGSVPMDVETSQVAKSASAKLPNEVSKSPTLMNTIPLNAPDDVEEMNIQEEKEYHRRKGEDEYINSLQSKIEVLKSKLQRAEEYKDIEVERLNKRRDVYDAKIKVKDIRRTTADSIRKRQRDEADQNDKVLKALRTRMKKQKNLDDLTIPRD